MVRKSHSNNLWGHARYRSVRIPQLDVVVHQMARPLKVNEPHVDR
jgi:hypothetical protein